MNIVTFDHLTELKECLNSKANNTDLQKIYDLKLNKSDISVMILSIDNMHKQLS